MHPFFHEKGARAVRHAAVPAALSAMFPAADASSESPASTPAQRTWQ